MTSDEILEAWLKAIAYAIGFCLTLALVFSVAMQVFP